MFEFELYCDDSGTDGNSPIAVAACYISTKSQWNEFVRNWDQVLRDEQFDHFHMAEFVAKPEARHEPFCAWDNAKKIRIYNKLASVINTRVRKGFGIAIPKDAFDRAAPQDFRNQFAKDHFTYAVHCLIGLIAQWREKYGVTSAIQYVFDQGSPQPQIEALWQVLSDYPTSSAKYGLAPNGYGFRDKKLFKPLQSADILAWQLRNHIKRLLDRYKSLSAVPATADHLLCHPGFRSLREGRRMELGWFSEEQIRKGFTELAEYELIHGKPAYPSLIIPKLVEHD